LDETGSGIVLAKKRRGWLAGVLTFLGLGLGHIYAGAPKKGIVFIAIFIGAIFGGGLFGIYSTFYGLVIFAGCVIILLVSAIASAMRETLKNSEYTLKWYNRWYWYILYLVVVSILLNLLSSYRGMILGYETYRIPAESMAPTLQVGDFITVDTRYKEVKVGDVIVFKFPKKPEVSFVKRVAALGSDRIAISNGQVIVNGEINEALKVKSDMRQREFSVSMPERVIPSEDIFVLGDWRDNSNDSRFWGAVPRENVVGKVTYIWFSRDFHRIGSIVR
jgi:signal peptidase I